MTDRDTAKAYSAPAFTPEFAAALLQDVRALTAPVPPGRLIARLLPDSIARRRTPGTDGVDFWVEILSDGPHKGRRVRLRFLSDGPWGVVDLHLGLIDFWADALDVGPAANITQQMTAIGKASVGRRIEIVIMHRPWPGGINLEIVDIEVLPRRKPPI